jgi:hypothetical protein
MRGRKISPFLTVAVAFLSMAESECEEVYDCHGACYHIAGCEDQWLEDEGESRMTEAERDRYMDECLADCNHRGSQDEMECVEEASCEDLLEGRCSD